MEEELDTTFVELPSENSERKRITFYLSLPLVFGYKEFLTRRERRD